MIPFDRYPNASPSLKQIWLLIVFGLLHGGSGLKEIWQTWWTIICGNLLLTIPCKIVWLQWKP